MWQWLVQNSTAVQALSAIAVAGLTCVLIDVTIIYVRKTSDIAVATRVNAEQQGRVATLMESDIALRLRPYLRFESHGGNRPITEAVVVNAGTGLAVAVEGWYQFAGSDNNAALPLRSLLEPNRPQNVQVVGDGSYLVTLQCTDAAGMYRYTFVWGDGRLIQWTAGRTKEQGQSIVLPFEGTFEGGHQS